MSMHIAIVGGGISGLATAHRLRKLRPDWNVVVLERDEVPGGKVRTTVRDGYTVEWGPNGFLASAPDTLALAHELGLRDELLPAADAAKKRYLFRDGALRALPTSPPGFLGTELVSAPGKLRAALEPMLARRCQDEETVHEFVARHFGKGVARSLSEALVLGVSAGDPRQLSLDALFPRMRTLEDDHRSLVLALLASQRSARSAGGLTSFRRGTAQLIGALHRALGSNLRTGTAVRAIRPGDRGGFELALGRVHDERDRDASMRVDGVVLAVPAFAAASLVAAWRPKAAELLSGIPFAPIRVFGLGYDRIDVPRILDGFGFLAPSGEGIRSLGVLWSSTVFPDHAPPGKVLLRILAGGVRDPEFIELSPSAALQAVRDDLRVSMGITTEPEFLERVDWPRAIPQYLVGHAARVTAIERELAGPDGQRRALALTGNSYRGVGLNDCVRDARSVADDLVARLEHGGRPGA